MILLVLLRVPIYVSLFKCAGHSDGSSDRLTTTVVLELRGIGVPFVFLKLFSVPLIIINIVWHFQVHIFYLHLDIYPFLYIFQFKHWLYNMYLVPTYMYLDKYRTSGFIYFVCNPIVQFTVSKYVTRRRNISNLWGDCYKVTYCWTLLATKQRDFFVLYKIKTNPF